MKIPLQMWRITVSTSLILLGEERLNPLMRFSPFPLAPAPKIPSKHIVYHLDIGLDRDKLVIIRSVRSSDVHVVYAHWIFYLTRHTCPSSMIPGEPSFFTIILALRISPCTNPASCRLSTLARTSLSKEALAGEVAKS